MMMAASRATNKKVEVVAIKPVVVKRKVGRPSATKIQRCRELGLTQIIPDSKAGHQYSLLKSEVIVLCAKLALEADCKKTYKRKRDSLNRTKLEDYLLTKLKDRLDSRL